MPVFIFHAEKGNEVIKGTMKAPSLQKASLQIKAQNMEPIYLKEKSFLSIGDRSKRVKVKDLMFFTRQFSFLLNSGLSLIQSLDLVLEMCTDEVLKRGIKQLLRKVKAGESFSRALRGCPEIFDSFYVNMIVCAEQTGLMGETLDELANYMEKAEGIRSKIRSAMMYPVIVLSISLLIVSAIIIFVVPKFQELYGSSNEAKLPFLTQMLVSLSELFRNNLITVVVVAVAVPLVIMQYIKTEQGKRQMAQIVSLLPLFGKLQYKAGLARFARAFSSLLKSGVNFLEALEVGYKISGHEKIMNGLLIAKKSVQQGAGFTKGLSRSKEFPPLLVGMAAIGEESGKLGETFTKLAEFYETEVDDIVSGLIKLIEPIMITVLGSIIGVIILALYLPVFKLGDVL